MPNGSDQWSTYALNLDSRPSPFSPDILDLYSTIQTIAITNMC